MKRWERNDQTKLCTFSSTSSRCGLVPFVLQWMCCTPHTSFELYLLFIQRQKQVKITGILLVGNTRESNLLN